jgi:hypothetical protein
MISRQHVGHLREIKPQKRGSSTGREDVLPGCRPLHGFVRLH